MKKTLVILSLVLILVLIASCGKPNTDAGQATPESNSENIYSSGNSENQISETMLQGNDEEKFLPLEVKEYGYALDNGYLFCAVALHNPNPDYCVEFPTFRLTAKDSDGLMLGTETHALSMIYPNQVFYYAGQMFKVEDVPATVDIDILSPHDYNIQEVNLLTHSNYEPLVSENIVMRDEHIMGEIKNNNDYDIDSAIVTVFYRDTDGNLGAGESTFINDLPASESVPFDIRVKKGLATENFEVYANIW